VVIARGILDHEKEQIKYEIESGDYAGTHSNCGLARFCTPPPMLATIILSLIRHNRIGRADAMGFRQRARKAWDVFANLWTAKDVVLAIFGFTGLGVVGAPLLAWAFSPMSPADFLVMATLGGFVSFGLACWLAPRFIRARHIHHRDLSAVTDPVASLEMTVFRPNDLPIRDAARRAFESIEGTSAEAVVSGLNDTAEQRICWFIEHILGFGCTVNAKKPPSTISRQIPPNILHRLHPVPGKNELKSDFASEPTHYIDVTVHADELERFLVYLRELAKQQF